MQQQPYTQWSETLHRNAVSKRIPINGTLELTRRCNLACRHCYNNLPLHDQPARRNELSTAELRRVLDELADAGCLWLLLTGGEPFARSDILDIYSAARDKGFIITLFTNATLISEQIADTLAARPPFSIEVTLYGATEKTYERITGVPGSYERCLRGIRLLQSRGLPLKLK
ncbi:MAG: radical SAM protein, partial [Deltaproteobacteria bacterium]|nr:radical SAM protein [Deltaproteobacteria bacterium]